MKNLLFFFLLGTFCLMTTLSAAQAVYEDNVYEDNIQSVRIYPKTAEFSSQLDAAVVALNPSTPLVLEFDDIAFDADRYSATLIHCNSDWTPSGLRPADYLIQYNEFNIDNYEYSINTRIPYIHFNFQIPPVTRSGNYVIKVYRGRQKDEVILTKRFMVYDNQLQVGAAVVPPSKTADRMSSQQINVTVNYGGRELMDPANNVKVVIRQNQSWGNSITGLRPTFIREDRSMIEYRPFDGSNTFSAGNEFRFVDLRYIRSKGRNIASIQIEEDAVFAETTLDQPRADQAYLEYLDMNGQYAVFTFDKQNHVLESEYVVTTFSYRSEELREPPYIVGSLSNWGKNPAAKMEYDNAKGVYQATLLLKQGWYDYQYGIKTPTGFEMKQIEGEHFQTENEYEVFVYYRAMGSRYDELIGYAVLNPNKRRL